MATATLGGLIAAARQLIPPDPDADLLRRFAATRDDGAFAALVARYGRLVLSACRRIVPDTHLADDAFQATFVVLATKAASLDGNRPLGPWLYAVACHVSTRARAMIGRRRKRETLTGTVPDVPDTSSGGTGFQAGDDQAAILDEEIGRLSAACRDAVVLCELQGLTRKQAAAKLGIAEGTLSSRLAAARKTLAARLRARGVAPAAGVISALFVPTDLAAATVAASTGNVILSPQLTALVQKGLAMTLFAKLKLVPAVVALGLLLLGAAGWGGSSNDTAVAAPVPKAEKDEGLIWVYDPVAKELVAHTPDGKKAKTVKLHGESADGQAFQGISDDGQFALFCGVDGKFPDAGTFYDLTRRKRLTLHRKPLHDDRPVTDTGIVTAFGNRCFTASDGGLILSRNVANIKDPAATKPEYIVTRYDRDGKNPTPLELPAAMSLRAALPNGEFLLEAVNREKPPFHSLWRCNPGQNPVRVSPDSENVEIQHQSASPDGRWALTTRAQTLTTQKEEHLTLAVFDIATGKERRLDDSKGTGFIRGFWSPDGKRVATQWHSKEEWLIAPGSTQWRPGFGEIAIRDADNANVRVVLKLDDPGEKVPVTSRRHLLGWFPTKPKAANPPKKNAPVPKDVPDPGLIWTLDGKAGTLTAFALDGTKKQDVALKSGRNFLGFSHDGELLLFLAKKGQPTEEQDGLTLHVGRPSDLARATDTGIGFDAKVHFSFLLTRDKKRVVQFQNTRNGPNPPVNWTLPSFRHTVIDLATKKETAIEMADHMQIVDESLDGEEWIVLQYNGGDDPKRPGNRYLRVPKNGGKPVPICDTHQFPFFMPSPDGRSYIGIGISLPPGDDLKRFNLYHFNPATGKATELEQFADTEQRNVRWSPDGKRYAVKKLGDADVFAADIDGKNRKKLFAVPDAGPETYFIGWFPAAPKAAAPPKKNAPVPTEKPPEGVILVSKLCTDPPNEILEVLDTSGKSLGHLPVGNLDNVRAARVSPDGKRLAFSLLNEKGKRHQFYSTEDLFVVDLPLTEPPKEPAFGDLLDPSFAWAPDGKTLVVSSIPGDTDVSLRAVTGTVMPRKTVRYDAATKKEKAIELPKGHAVQDMTPDGKTLLTQVKVWNRGGFGYSSFLVPLDTLMAKRIGDEDDGFAIARFSPVGNRIVGTRVERTKSNETGLFLADATTGKVDSHPLSKELTTGLFDASVTWAPDGRRLAVLWSVPAPGAPGLPGGAPGPPGAASRRQITVLDSDGKNAKTIREFAPTESPRHIDWADPKRNEKEKSPAPQPKKNAPVPKAEVKPGVVLHLSGYGLGTRLYDGGSGKLLLTLKDEAPGFKRGDARLSPDGKWVAVLGQVMVVTPPGVPARPQLPEVGNQKLYMVDVTGDGGLGEPIAEGLNPGRLVWAADGNSLFFAENAEERGRRGNQAVDTTFHGIDAKTGKKVALPKLDGYFPVDVSPDGKTLLASKFGPEKKPGGGWERTDHMIDLATFKISPVDDVAAQVCQFHPDGNGLIVTRPADPKKPPGIDDPLAFFVYDLATKKETPVPLPAEAAVASARVYHALPSRDGKRWLFVWTEAAPPPAVWPAGAQSAATRFTTADAAGRNGKTIFRQGADGRDDLIRGHFHYVEFR